MKNISVTFSLFTLFGLIASASVEFKQTKLILGNATISAELADTEERRERGLMERTTLKDSQGMIFVFDHPQQQGFWMKDTLIPLSIGFLDASGKLFQILDMDPASPVELHPKIYLSAKPALYALEVAQGWFVRKKIPLGSQMKIPELHIPDR
jgi:uncharacterized membrane protein (UPF0127 family)